MIENKEHPDRPAKIRQLLNSMTELFKAGEDGIALLDYITKIEESRKHMRVLLERYKGFMLNPKDNLLGLGFSIELTHHNPHEFHGRLVAEITEIENALILPEEENISEISRQDTIGVLSRALDSIWQLIYPGKTHWEYPNQVAAHIAVELEHTETLRASARPILEAYSKAINVLRTELGQSPSFDKAQARITEWIKLDDKFSEIQESSGLRSPLPPLYEALISILIANDDGDGRYIRTRTIRLLQGLPDEVISAYVETYKDTEGYTQEDLLKIESNLKSLRGEYRSEGHE